TSLAAAMTRAGVSSFSVPRSSSAPNRDGHHGVSSGISLTAAGRERGCDLEKDLDRPTRGGEGIDQPAIVLQALDGMGEEAGGPPGNLSGCEGQIPYRGLEVLPIAVDRPDHDLVSENEAEVDRV